MTKKKLLITPHYLPCTAYIAHLYQYPTLSWEVSHFYEKQTYQNRCYILGPQGVQPLIIPIQHTGKKQYYKDVKIDYSTPWHIKQMRTLSTAYGKAPYFHALTDLLFPILTSQPTFLLDLHLDTLAILFRFLDLHPPTSRTHTYQTHLPAEMLDLRNAIHPKRKNPISSPPLPIYTHLFDHPFTPNLSIIDLLYCEGPAAKAFFTAQEAFRCVGKKEKVLKK